LRVTKTIQIMVTGVLAVTVTPVTPKGYVGVDAYVDVAWSPSPSGDYDIAVQWGDGTSVADASMSSPKRVGPKKYTAPGTYTVTITVVEPVYGYQGTGTTTIQVANPLTATLGAAPTSGPAPLAVTFTLGAAEGWLPYTWSLDPGDGSAPYTGSRTAKGNWTQAHTYMKAGTHTSTLTVTDALGATTLTRVTARTYAPAGLPSAAAILTPLVAGLILLKGRR